MQLCGIYHTITKLEHVCKSLQLEMTSIDLEWGTP